MSVDHTVQPGTPLTARELECMRLVADGLPDAEIGASLHISPATVKTNLQRAYRRLGAKSRPNAVYLALKAGVIQ